MIVIFCFTIVNLKVYLSVCPSLTQRRINISIAYSIVVFGKKINIILSISEKLANRGVNNMKSKTTSVKFRSNPSRIKNIISNRTKNTSNVLLTASF